MIGTEIEIKWSNRELSLGIVTLNDHWTAKTTVIGKLKGARYSAREKVYKTWKPQAKEPFTEYKTVETESGSLTDLCFLLYGLHMKESLAWSITETFKVSIED